MSTTRLALIGEIATCDGLGFATGVCSAAGTTTTILDTSADSPLQPSDDEGLYESAWAKVSADSAGTPLNVGEVRRVKDDGGYVPASGTLTLDRAFSNATTTTQTYQLFFGVPPIDFGTRKGIVTFLNEALRNLRYCTQLLLTLATDGDMETSGVTNWTASSVTATKSTSTGVTMGDQALRVANSGANGYAAAVNIPVAEFTTYHVIADVKVASGTAKLIAYDATASANIDTAQTAEIRQGYLYLDNVYIPSGCQNLSLRLSGVEASADATWDNLSVRLSGMREIALPSWFVKPEWLEYIYTVLGGSREQDNDSYAVSQRYQRKLHSSWRVEVDHTGYTPYRLVGLPYLGHSEHLFAQCWRPCGELSADTDSTDADKDWVIAHTRARIFADIGDRERASFWRDEASRLDRRWAPRYEGPAFRALVDL